MGYHFLKMPKTRDTESSFLGKRKRTAGFFSFVGRAAKAKRRRQTPANSPRGFDAATTDFFSQKEQYQSGKNICFNSSNVVL